MSTKTNFHGVYPILYSFFDEQGQLAREAMRRQVEGCIAGGAHGIAVMGLATEVGKLDVNERRRVIEWVGEDINGRVPYAVTVGEGSVSGQIEFVKGAQAVGLIGLFCSHQPLGAFPKWNMCVSWAMLLLNWTSP